MPALEQLTKPIYSGKALQDKQNRNSRAWAYFKAEYVGVSAIALKRVAKGLVDDFKASTEPGVRCNIARVLCQVLEQQRVLYRIPAPGRDTPSEAKTIEMPAAAAIDVQEIERMARDAERAVSESEQPPVSPTESAS